MKGGSQEEVGITLTGEWNHKRPFRERKGLEEE